MLAVGIAMLGCSSEVGNPCRPFGRLVTSMAEGAGFDSWEGEPVRGEFLSAESFASGSDVATVASGRFSLTASTCSGIEWRISVGASGHEISCGEGVPVTPAVCWCQNGSVWVDRGPTGRECAAFDGGAPEAPAGD